MIIPQSCTRTCTFWVFIGAVLSFSLYQGEDGHSDRYTLQKILDVTSERQYVSYSSNVNTVKHTFIYTYILCSDLTLKIRLNTECSNLNTVKHTFFYTCCVLICQ